MVYHTNTLLICLTQPPFLFIFLLVVLQYAAGSLVQGAMEQIKRCDIHPEGWMTNAGGARVSDPSSWSCTNMTINAASELPENCQYSSFWTLGGFDQAYAGVEKVNGMNCDKWTYRMQDEGTGKIDDYAFWCAKDHAVPVATGRVGSPTGDGLYTIFFSNFAPGAPAESQFAPQPGSDCPASTPPRDNASAGDAKKNKNKGSISNVNCLHKQAALRQNN